jgi:hypothetical protein
MEHEEEIFAIADAKEGYLACERSMNVVRRYRQSNDLQGAMSFLMRLAHRLAANDLWKPAATAARRSIDLFPHEATTIQISLKKQFWDFADSLTPAAVCRDMFKFLNRLMGIFNSRARDILLLQSRLADAADQFYVAQGCYIHLLNIFPPTSRADESSIVSMAAMVWRWMGSLDCDNAALQGGLLITRATLGLAGCEKDGPHVADIFLSEVRTLAHQSRPSLMDQPVIHFSVFFVRALIAKHRPTLEFLLERYQPGLEIDPDILGLAKLAKDRALAPPGGQGIPSGFDLNSMFRNLFGGRRE